MTPKRRMAWIVAPLAGVAIALGTAVPASATPALSATATAQVAQSPTMAPAVTSASSTYKSCYTFNTTSLLYKNDWMGVKRWKSSNGYWYYTITRSSNRYTYQTTSSSVYPWYHQARAFFVYWNSSSYSTFNYPGNTLTVRSSSAYVDFKLYMSLTASYIYKSTSQCYIYF